MIEKTNNKDREEHRKQIQELLTEIERSLKVQLGKVTIADYIRLLQYERELGSTESPREVKVTWVEQTRNSEE